jgi:hypothetical protein
MSRSHLYRIFGLVLSAPCEIETLKPAAIEPVGPPDVEIRFEPLSPAPSPIEYLGMLVQSSSEGLHLQVPGDARFLVSGGRTIIASLEREDRPQTAFEYLLGTAMGALLHQRGLLPLHANVIEWNGRAFAFAGASGAGKSTLAARLHQKGYNLLSDDICAIAWDDAGEPRVFPGIPRVKLWSDALKELGIARQGLQPLSWTTEKLEAPVQSTFGQRALPLAVICELREEEEAAPRGTYVSSGLDAANALIAHTYRRRLADLQGLGGECLGRILSLAGNVPVVLLRRRWGFAYFDEEVDTVEQIMRDHAHHSGSRR